jgi:hypothetical protein
MTEKEMPRNQKWSLGNIRHAKEVKKNVAKTCSYFGIPPKKWKHSLAWASR